MTNSTKSCVDVASNETFRYPPLSISPNSLRLATTNASLASALLIMSNSFPTLVAFAGSGFLNDARFVSVSYGPSAANKNEFTCELGA